MQKLLLHRLLVLNFEISDLVLLHILLCDPLTLQQPLPQLPNLRFIHQHRFLQLHLVLSQ
jgi:hypothetical protein